MYLKMILKKILKLKIIIFLLSLIILLILMHFIKINKIDNFVTNSIEEYKNDEIKINFYPYSSVANKDGCIEKDKQSNYVCNAPEFNNSSLVSLKYDIWCCGWLLYDMSWVSSDSEKLLSAVQNFDDWTKPNLPADFSNELKQIFEE